MNIFSNRLVRRVPWQLMAAGVAAATVILLLSACTATGRTGAAVVTDKVLDSAIFTKCKAATIGAIDRRYMQTPEAWALWIGECRVNPDG